MTDRCAVANRAARVGAETAIERFELDFTITTKCENELDFVTEVDVAAQEAILEVIRDSYPDDAIVGEEGDELIELLGEYGLNS